MNKVPDNKLSSVKTHFLKELTDVVGTREAELYFEACCMEWLRMTRVEILTNKECPLSESEILRFLHAVKEFKKHKPLSYVLGTHYFFGLTFKVDEGVLIPRPETEELVDLIISENKGEKSLRVLDIGTGSGCIAILLKSQLKESKVVGLDISQSALQVAKENAALNNLDVDFRVFDISKDSWEQGESFDIIVSNPPYIPTKEMKNMAENVLNYEPHLALFVPDEDPLLFYRLIADFAMQYGADGARIYFEIHEDYGDEMKELLQKKGFKNLRLQLDLQGKERMLSAIK